MNLPQTLINQKGYSEKIKLQPVLSGISSVSLRHICSIFSFKDDAWFFHIHAMPHTQRDLHPIFAFARTKGHARNLHKFPDYNKVFFHIQQFIMIATQ